MREIQNTTHAVMSQRHETDPQDDFPTHPWAVRGFLRTLANRFDVSGTAWEPAAGRGYMAQTLAETFDEVWASDKYFYPGGYSQQMDFLETSVRKPNMGCANWIITNPPFSHAEDFVRHALRQATDGVAMIVRMPFLETVGRWQRLFSQSKPAVVYQHVERVPMHKGRLLKKGSTATAYCWVVWSIRYRPNDTAFDWIPPCREELMRPSDYEAEFLQPVANLKQVGW